MSETTQPTYRLDRSRFTRRASPVVVREYREPDAAFLGRLLHETVHAVCRADYTQDELAAWAPAAAVDSPRWRERFASTRPWVAVEDDRPVGFLELLPDGHVECCYVHHRFQRRGVGTALLARALATARGAGVARLYADVSITAVPFFRAHGFAITRPQQVERNGATLRNFRMERIVVLEEES